MRLDRTGLLSLVSAAVIATLTLFVFGVLQNYGPESAIRRLHTVTNRVDRYTLPNVDFEDIRFKPEDAAEYSMLLMPVKEKESFLVMKVVRDRLYENARYSIVRIDYKTPRLALAVVEYELPYGTTDLRVFVLQKPRRSWMVDLDETARVLRTVMPNVLRR